MQPNSRPGWDQYYMGIAMSVRSRADCLGNRVGAILVLDDRIISTGYNGTPASMTNCTDGGCERCADRERYQSGSRYDLCICVHAEQNALLAAARFGIATEGAVLYSTMRPCFGCTKELLQAGVQGGAFPARVGVPGHGHAEAVRLPAVAVLQGSSRRLRRGRRGGVGGIADAGRRHRVVSRALAAFLCILPALVRGAGEEIPAAAGDAARTVAAVDWSVAVDGDLNEWGPAGCIALDPAADRVGHRGVFSGWPEQEADVCTSWDAANLYVAVAVTDDHLDAAQVPPARRKVRASGSEKNAMFFYDHLKVFLRGPGEDTGLNIWVSRCRGRGKPSPGGEGSAPSRRPGSPSWPLPGPARGFTPTSWPFRGPGSGSTRSPRWCWTRCSW